ncbi:MAG: 4Fe-4S binding protein [Chloroflexi bacterium]|nr:4Fe-4S binding protein [Chloroflexota bacterium]
MSEWVITTNRARCRDCYRCVRICPVKAVRVENGQAQIVPELCVACGSCVRECPQGAKVVRDDRALVRQAIKSGRPVYATVAPSAPAYFGIKEFDQLHGALEQLGFTDAFETAFGAQMVAPAHREFVEHDRNKWPIVASACPVVVNLFERYYPDLLAHLAPIVSPMIAHGRYLRNKYGPEALIVFIGPCIAKKEELRDPEVAGAVDAALTFNELEEWLGQDNVALPEPSAELADAPQANARLFPVEGGLVGTARMNTDMLSSQIIATSGMDACRDVLDSIRSGELTVCMAELMACDGGCINGPVMSAKSGPSLARQKVMAYAGKRQTQPLPSPEERPNLERKYNDHNIKMPDFAEERIREVMRLVDKYTPEDELNCGACGYATCRDKAIATLRGMAESTMCIPYMRRRADSLRQLVMDVTPNAIIIVDKNLRILDMSPSAQRMFERSLNSVQGQPINMVIPLANSFERVHETGIAVMNELLRINDNLVVEQSVVPVTFQNMLMAILRDVTEREVQQAELTHIRTETLTRTQEVIANQMRVAQEIAQLLGETTAETKMALTRLAKLIENGES